MAVFDRLEAVAQRFDEIEAELGNPSGAFDQARYLVLTKERAALEELVAAYREYRALEGQQKGAEELVSSGDPEMRELAQEELGALRLRAKDLAERLRVLMLPKDPNDDKDIFIEVRAGAGGEEASLFAAELVRMYLRYAESLDMKAELLALGESESGGYKDAVVAVKGKGAYGHFKYESGVHRVQRVPQTEAQGRVHTSTATVAVLPEAEEVDIEINPKDLQIDTYKSSGAGGQHVNKTESAIRITHVPSGVVVACQEERSQTQNRERAMGMLRSVLLDRKTREQEAAMGSLRRSQVGTGDRSEKIRTYNFPQDRLTDHRINANFGNIRGIMEGDMDKLVVQLQRQEQERLLAGETSVA